MPQSRTPRERLADGTLSLSEIDRRHAAWSDQQPTITTCVCGRRFTGSAVEGRDWFREHMKVCERRRKCA